MPSTQLISYLSFVLSDFPYFLEDRAYIAYADPSVIDIGVELKNFLTERGRSPDLGQYQDMLTISKDMVFIGFFKEAGEAAAVFGLMGVASIAGRVPVGIASDKIGRKLTAIICVLLQAGAMLWLMWAQDLWMFYLFVLVFGFAHTGFGTSMGALIGDIFGLGKIGATFGVLELGFGIGAAIGPVVGGLIFDVTNSYFMAFLIGALAMVVSTLLIALVRRETS